MQCIPSPPPPTILIVDDEPFNIAILEQELEDAGYRTLSAADGRSALAQVAATAPDLVLLDIMMPVMDGFAVLERLKADPETRDIPVVVISAVTDIASVARGIAMGAVDYLPKPFDPTLLQARVEACLEQKRLRDAERAYLRQVALMTEAAASVQRGDFAPEQLAPVARRVDALGTLARVFQAMVDEVRAREQRLRRQIEQLRQDIEEQRQAAAETAAAYLPMDRRLALAEGRDLAPWSHGAALFADISGFTALTEALARELGPQRGAEELTRQLNRVFGALIEVLHRHGGCAITFSGDAITCWFDEPGPPSGAGAAPPAALRAIACALAMQAAMPEAGAVATGGGASFAIALKVAVAAGAVRRCLVGDPTIQRLETLAGRVLDELARGEHLARPGEVLAAEGAARPHADALPVSEWRRDVTGIAWAVLAGAAPPAEAPWPPLAPERLPAERARQWLLGPVYERLRSGAGLYLAELRPVTALFLSFGGVDYEAEDAGARLDAFVRWVQAVVGAAGGAVHQVTMGEKGSFLYATFGAPVAHEDDAVRAVGSALELAAPPPRLGFSAAIKIGVASGVMRTGAYGGPARRTYGVLGDATNLAARLMQAAPDILCDEATALAAQARWRLAALPPIRVKGKREPVPVFRPTGAPASAQAAIDALPPAEQLTLKVASVIGPQFDLEALAAIYPAQGERALLAERLEALARSGLLTRQAESPTTYAFSDLGEHAAVYGQMLFAQRRRLHRSLAEWYEAAFAADLEPRFGLLAHHWGRAEDAAKTQRYLELAAEHARRTGAYEQALSYLHAALAAEAGRGGQGR